MEIIKGYSREDKLINRLILLSVLRVILPKLQEFICSPYYWGHESGTPTEEMAVFFWISGKYNFWVIKILVPIITILIIYILCEILRGIVHSIVKK